MDHSFQGYLTRRSIEELKLMLNRCREDPAQYGYLEEMIRDALQRKLASCDGKESTCGLDSVP